MHFKLSFFFRLETLCLELFSFNPRGRNVNKFFLIKQKDEQRLAINSCSVPFLFDILTWNGILITLPADIARQKDCQRAETFSLFFLSLGHIDLFQRILRDAVYYSSCTARHLNTYRIRKGLQASPCK